MMEIFFNSMLNEISKLEFISNVLEMKEFDEKNLFISALVSCLSPETVCNVVKVQQVDNRLKKHILRKIYRDIESKRSLNIYETFIEELMNEFYVQYKVAYMLHYFYHVLSYSFKDKILILFSNSHYPSIRDRAYKIISETWENNYFEIISNMWNRFRDYGCAFIIINRFPLEFLVKNLCELEKIMEQNDMLYKLQIRMASEVPKFLEKIKNKDGITYVHVLTKLGKKLSNEEALAIFNEYKLDSRVGLLISSFGQMGLWDTIQIVLKNTIEERESKASVYVKVLEEV